MPAKKPASKKPSAKTTAKAAPKTKKPAKPMIEEEHSDFPQKECEHCLGVGKCTAGEPYDKGHHQMFGARVILTSCVECLESAGEHKNSKKIVACHFCVGTGHVKA